MIKRFFGLPPAQLHWSDNGEPEDIKSGDVYFSANDGRQETETVFLGGCDLPNRWKDQPVHTIGELGFGTGLNLLTTMAMWQRTRQAGQVLHYISVENSPLTADEITRAHLRFPELKEQAKQLQKALPPAIKGFHRCNLGPDIVLSLLYGPAQEMLTQLSANIDSWFLDGFAPAKNPQMWSDQVFNEISRLSAPEARLATYSVAGTVRRGLSSIGFEVQKKTGHAYKRHRLEASLSKQVTATDPNLAAIESVMIIGCGIAGACLAYELSKTNIDCTIIDENEPASGASGNPIGLVSARLDIDDTPLSRFYRTAFSHAVQFYQINVGSSFSQTGIRRLAQSDEQWQKFSILEQAQALPKEMLRLDETNQEMLLPSAGTLKPKAAIKALLANTKILKRKVANIANQNGKWIANGQDGHIIAKTDIVILATGVGKLAGLGLPGLRNLRGQISIASGISQLPKTPLIGKSYVINMGEGQALFGATHDRVNEITDIDVRQIDHQRNLEDLQKLAPKLAKQIELSKLSGRSSYRAASPDLQPLAGPVPDVDACANWAKTHWGKLNDYSSAPMQGGLYMLNGLGSRGLTLAPILAKAIISMITNTPSPLENEAQTALHPARFAARNARRKA